MATGWSKKIRFQDLPEVKKEKKRRKTKKEGRRGRERGNEGRSHSRAPAAKRRKSGVWKRTD